MIFSFDLILSGPAQGINPAATFSRVSAKCFAGLVPELTPQAKSKAPVQEKGEQQEHRAGNMAEGVELLPVRYLLVASLCRDDGCSATLMDELYSLDEGRELFD